MVKVDFVRRVGELQPEGGGFELTMVQQRWKG